MSRIGVARIDTRFVRAAGRTRDDIAWVIAHEFAHFILNHPARRAVVAHTHGSEARERTAASKAHELEADRLGLRLATAAGFAFDPQAFFAQLRKGRLAGESVSHPADGVRIRVMRSAARGAS
jgi:predicted Zn-dependent protease